MKNPNHAARASAAIAAALKAERRAQQHYRDAQTRTAAAVAAARAEGVPWAEVCDRLGGVSRQAALQRINAHLNPDGTRRNLSVPPVASRLGRATLDPELLDQQPPTVRVWWVHTSVTDALNEVCGAVADAARHRVLDNDGDPTDALDTAARAAHAATVAALHALREHHATHPDALVSDGSVAAVAADAARNAGNQQ